MPAVTSAPEDAFTSELAAARKAEDRDSRVDHLRKALAARPNDPGNIAIEFEIGIELSQRDDPVRKQGPRREEALPVFEHIMSAYRHMDYYQVDALDHSGSPQLMVPDSAVLASCLQRGLNHDPDKAREQLLFAMDCLKETYEKRVKDWADTKDEPPPKDDDPFNGGPMGIAKWKSRQHLREKRRMDAAEGNVFGPLEMASVEASVRQFGYTYGPQKAHEVPVVMGEIVKRYPGTPMAKVAQGRIGKAISLTEKDLFRQLPPLLESPYVPPQGPSSGPATSSSQGKPSALAILMQRHAEEQRLAEERTTRWTVGLIAVGVLFMSAVCFIYRRRLLSSFARTRKPSA